MTGKKLLLVVLLIAAGVAAAAAHPLGNFTINQYSRLEVEKSRIKIRQVLDIAEIPTFQLQSDIDTDRDGNLSDAELNAYVAQITPAHLAGLSLTVNNQPLEIHSESAEIQKKEGAGNLTTLLIKWNLVAEMPETAAGEVKFENRNYADRMGWNEIVLNRVGDVNIYNANAFGSGVTNELESYPQERLDEALAERSAKFTFSVAAAPAGAAALQNRDGHVNTAVQKDRLAELLKLKEITPAVALFGLLLAFGLGTMHAMSPGHGKTVVGAYLVGSRGTPAHAVFLGLTVTVTHTLGVFALGLITLFASKYILPEKLMPFLSFFSGLIVLYIGLTMFKERLFAALGWKQAAHAHDGTAHSHAADAGVETAAHQHSAHDAFTHTHDGNTHSHLPPERISWKNLLALGISGGLLPCPSALVLMLSAISAGRIGYGLLLTLVFSFGLAATLTIVGLVFLYVGKAFGGSQMGQYKIVKALPVFSAFVIACLGAVICYTSL